MTHHEQVHTLTCEVYRQQQIRQNLAAQLEAERKLSDELAEALSALFVTGDTADTWTEWFAAVAHARTVLDSHHEHRFGSL